MAKRTRMQLHTSEHGDAAADGVQDTGSTPVASTTPFQSQVFERRLAILFIQIPSSAKIGNNVPKADGEVL